MEKGNAEWGNLFRRTEVYQMLWSQSTPRSSQHSFHRKDVDLERYLCVGAPYGGPLAMVRDEQKLLMLGSGEGDGVRPMMRVYTANGSLISDFMWMQKVLFWTLFFG